ncbi:MgtC/SapB family protein [Ruminococcaceae bacterium OttesenSCG-928-N02]|nr:MgtC/SapB family protein [Ruminococcaceae bacterium OttesenSCG-928-N02]
MQFEALRDLNLLSICIRFLLALLIGGLLGWERGQKHHPAGLRTYMLVCIGAAMVMMTNQYISIVYGGDPVRMGAQVVSGIGFLGAGTIIVTGKQRIKGITTAAGLWTAACCGLAIGIGFYELAVIGGVLVWVVMAFFPRMEYFIRKAAKSVDLYIEFEPDFDFSNFVAYVQTLNITMADVQMHRSERTADGGYAAQLTVSGTDKISAELTGLLFKAPGVRHIEELK